jgi:hypothetical protein
MEGSANAAVEYPYLKSRKAEIASFTMSDSRGMDVKW